MNRPDSTCRHEIFTYGKLSAFVLTCLLLIMKNTNGRVSVFQTQPAWSVTQNKTRNRNKIHFSSLCFYYCLIYSYLPFEGSSTSNMATRSLVNQSSHIRPCSSIFHSCPLITRSWLSDGIRVVFAVRFFKVLNVVSGSTERLNSTGLCVSFPCRLHAKGNRLANVNRLVLCNFRSRFLLGCIT